MKCTQTLDGKPEGKGPLARPCSGWKYKKAALWLYGLDSLG